MLISRTMAKKEGYYVRMKYFFRRIRDAGISTMCRTLVDGVVTHFTFNRITKSNITSKYLFIRIRSEK